MNRELKRSDDIHLDSFLKSSNPSHITKDYKIDEPTQIFSQALFKHNYENKSDMVDSNLSSDFCLNGNKSRLPNKTFFRSPVDDITIRQIEQSAHCDSKISFDQEIEKETFHQNKDQQQMSARQRPLNRPIGGHEPSNNATPTDQLNGQFLDPEDADSSDMLNSSSQGENSEQISRRRLMAGMDSDIDNGGPLEDEDQTYRMRSQARRQRHRRHDSSTGDAETDTMCGRNRREESLSRGYRGGLSRSSTRVGTGLRAGTIPPPPSEPPPSIPMDLGIQYNMYPTIGFNMGQPMVSVSGGTLNSGLSTNMLPLTGLPPGYLTQGGMMNADAASQQFFHAAMLQQQQQQHAVQQQQIHQHILTANAAAAMGGVPGGQPYFQGFHTIGRPSRTASFSLGQITGLQHPQPINYNQPALTDLRLVQPSTAAMLLQAQADQAAAINPPSVGGSGSVVYENSYNSFQRVPTHQRIGQMPSTISHDLISTGPNNDPSNHNSDPGNNPNNNSTSSPSTAGETLLKASSPLPPHQMMGGGQMINFYDTNQQFTPGNIMTTNAIAMPGKSTSGTGNGNMSVGIAKPFWYCSWHIWVILICVLAFVLALSFAVFFNQNAKWLENRLYEKYTQDPAIFGLFNPQNPPQTIESGKPLPIHIGPMGVWAGQWTISVERCTVYNLTVPSEHSSIGIFIRYSTVPTIVHYNYFDRILGRQLKADRSSSLSGATGTGDEVKKREGFSSLTDIGSKPNSPRTSGRVRCLKKGIWFISLVNDQPRNEEVVLSMAETSMPRGCPNDCSNRGICSNGVCDCLNGLTGKDCSSTEELPICSGHGNYFQGACQCYPEWKGSECETLWSKCLDPTCSNKGRCVTGDCHCFPGYGGDACQLQTCASHNCTGNGICSNGICRCFSGWIGDACSQPFNAFSQAVAAHVPPLEVTPSTAVQEDAPLASPLPDPACSLNGYMDFNGMCRCRPGFEGKTCEKGNSIFPSAIQSNSPILPSKQKP